MPAQTIDPRLKIRTNRDGSPRPVNGKAVWSARVSRDSEDNGGRKQSRFSFNSNNRRAVQGAFEAWLGKLQSGSDIKPSKLTVARYFQDWVDAARTRFAGTSYSRFENINRNHVVPKLGTIPLQKLTARHLNRTYAEWREAGLSEQTVTHHHRFIHRVLAQAEREGVVQQNVAARADKPKPPDSERRALSVKELDALFAAAVGSRLYPLIYVAAATGCRRGELLGVKYADLDLGEGVLHVRRSLQQYRVPRKVDGKPVMTAKGKPVFDVVISEKPPKNGKVRTVALTQGALEVLRSYRRAVAGIQVPSADTYVFPDADGVSPWVPTKLPTRSASFAARLKLWAPPFTVCDTPLQPCFLLVGATSRRSKSSSAIPCRQRPYGYTCIRQWPTRNEPLQRSTTSCREPRSGKSPGGALQLKRTLPPGRRCDPRVTRQRISSATTQRD
jgi:integrase